MKRLPILLGLMLAVALPAIAIAGDGKLYRADLQPLNAGVNGLTASGSATVTLMGNDVSVDIAVTGVNPGTLHAQHIHAGTACPSPDTDPNGDGFLDVIEGLPAYGEILVNLDSELSSNPAGMFPVADASGSYTYSETASRSHLQDEIETALRLGTRHVVIHGVDPATDLPDSVASLGGLPAWVTLPVACGELVLQK